MSQAVPTKCLVESCPFYENLIYADKSTIKNHIRHHDYKELQETAFKLGIIDDPAERRSPSWFVDNLCEHSIIRETVQ